MNRQEQRGTRYASPRVRNHPARGVATGVSRGGAETRRRGRGEFFYLSSPRSFLRVSAPPRETGFRANRQLRMTRGREATRTSYLVARTFSALKTQKVENTRCLQ